MSIFLIYYESGQNVKYFYSQYFFQLTDAVWEVVVSGRALVTEGAAVVLAARTLEVAADLVLDHADREAGAAVLQRALGEAGAGFAVGVVVVALDQWEVSTEVT